MDSADTQMATQGAQPGQILRRMIAERDLAQTPRRQAAAAADLAGEVTRERAAATALGRAAERLHHLPIFVEATTFAPMSLSEMPELLPERALLAVIEGGRDTLGVVAICPGFLTSLIEMQALGRVTSRPAVPRRATRTDATIAADFVNLFLAELGRELSGRDSVPSFGNFRYATYLDDPRPLALMLEDGEMMRMTMKFRIGSGGQRDGTITIALPMPTGAPQASSAQGSGTALLAGPDAAPAPIPAAAEAASLSLAAAMQQAPVPLVGVLARRVLSLGALRGLTAGATISLPANALDEVRIETASGQFIARARLGEAEGRHALRLKRAADLRAAPSAPAAPEAADLPMGDVHRPDAFRSDAQAPQPPHQNTA
ncbi:FliM/FliN family flagellar motor C-terminal domain-containing protein [Paracoccus shanxieyensis]|uniref:Flagellar motor switch protein FliN-like C-terminal domain-containing protein n=1 Tax=Paracoccus shanxieyensis TaxID=2675752 RepID=A0A6L6IWA4_9RHOB|nr:FliM/FliN family flagellar motor C-terminal domain-containing protein [Paracoccus shanxieyensis]MTH63911.1 hypothetical protein [Paracoccus shanxieyensis]MTH86577.1 hypothetical protein [Paracoccus shanxieyensis]